MWYIYILIILIKIEVVSLRVGSMEGFGGKGFGRMRKEEGEGGKCVIIL